jgi:hypothetical protein
MVQTNRVATVPSGSFSLFIGKVKGELKNFMVESIAEGRSPSTSLCQREIYETNA